MFHEKKLVRKKIDPSELGTIPRSPYCVPQASIQEATRPPLRTKVCLIGANCFEFPLTPEEDEGEEWEVWSCNALWSRGLDRSGLWRADRWFELHPYSAQSQMDLLYLRQAPCPVYVLQSESNWAKNFIVYPFGIVSAHFPRAAYSSTFAYQIALAIFLGFTTIRVVGVAMFYGREALIERPNLLYWVGLAQGRKVKIEFDDWTMMHMSPYLYGYDYTAEKEWVEEYCRNVLPSVARDGYRGSR